MKFIKYEKITKADIKKWFNDSFYADEEKIVHIYKHDNYNYDIVTIDKKFGTVYQWYINTLTAYMSKQMLSDINIHDKHIIDNAFMEV